MAKLISLLLIELIAVAAMTAPAPGVIPRAQKEQQGQKIKVGAIEFFGIGESSRQKAVGRKQKAVGGKQEAEGRKQEAGGRKQETGGGRKEAVGRRQKAGGRKQKAKDAKKYTRAQLEQLRRALPVKEGDELSFEAIEAARDSIKRAITRAHGQPPTDVSPVCCDDHGDLVFFIGLPGPAFRKVQYNPTPRGPKVGLHPPADAGGTDKRTLTLTRSQGE